MKTRNLLLTGVAAFATFTFAAVAGDATLSPKATQMQSEFRKVSGTTSDAIDRSAVGSPKAIATAESLRKVSGAGGDYIARNLPVLSPRALSNSSTSGDVYHLAPLK